MEVLSALNYLLTSTCWGNDHNGFSHQGPGFMDTIISKKGIVARVYLPPAANCLLSVAAHCLRSSDYINLIIIDKQPLVCNETSRYHLAILAIDAIDAIRRSRRPLANAAALIDACTSILARQAAHVAECFEDLPEIRDWAWPGNHTESRCAASAGT
jgi:phosphoketolase